MLQNIPDEHGMAKIDLSDIDVPSLITDIWTPLTSEQRSGLASHLDVQMYKKNEVVHYENELPTHMYCLLSGKVKVYKEGAQGRRQIARLIKPVGYFGYRAYFSQEEYVNSAAAVEPSVICSIPMKVIDNLIKNNNDLAVVFIRQLSKSLGIADRRAVDITQKHIQGRLAESLFFLKESYGVEEDGCTLSIYLSREDLANLSNMTTSNAIRVLSQFSAEHLIAIDGRKIKLIDEDKLRKICKFG